MIVLLLLSSCDVEKQIAQEYVNYNKNNTSVLILRPDYILKKDKIKDSELIDKDFSLNDVSDSVFIKDYFDNLFNELRTFGFKVYTDINIDSFLNADTSAYVFNISQILLEESVTTKIEDAEYDENLYEKTFMLNTVTVNSWFEATKTNKKENQMQVLYSEHFINDYIKGRFVRNILFGDVEYKYTRNNITLDDVYRLSAFAGKKNADYIFDYLLNEHIYKKIQKPKKYYRYNRVTGKIEQAYLERFIFM